MSGAVEGVALLPCPFCGGEAASDVYAGSGRVFYTIGCNNDLCAASCHFTGYEGLEPLIPLWNTRTTPPARSYADDDQVYAKGRQDGYAAGRSHALDDAAQVADDYEQHTGDPAFDAATDVAAVTIGERIRLLSQGGKA